MIRKLRIENFKSLKDTKELRIAPLTFLVGPNSSGKSSLLHALLMLKQTVGSRDAANPLSINGSYISLGTYTDFIYNHNNSALFKIALEFDIREKYMNRMLLGELGENINLDSTFRYSKTKMIVQLEEVHLSSPSKLDSPNAANIKEICIKRGVRTSYTLKGQRNLATSDSKEDVFKGVKLSKFYGIRNMLSGSRQLARIYERFIFRAEREIEAFFEQFYYIGPLRAWPKRFYVAAGETPQDVGFGGELGVDVLLACRYTKIKRLRGLLDKVKKWISDFNIGLDVKLKRIGKGNYYQLVIVDSKTKIDANLPDVGFGVSQILPVIIEGHYASPGSTLLIEQPEIHLHPKAQAVLGDLLISVMKEKRSLIVETHSEHLIARIRTRIAEGVIKKEDVAIYYFMTTPEGTKIEEITLDEFGQFEKWPEGFFEEDYEEALKHYSVIAKRTAEANG